MKNDDVPLLVRDPAITKSIGVTMPVISILLLLFLLFFPELSFFVSAIIVVSILLGLIFGIHLYIIGCMAGKFISISKKKSIFFSKFEFCGRKIIFDYNNKFMRYTSIWVLNVATALILI